MRYERKNEKKNERRDVVREKKKKVTLGTVTGVTIWIYKNLIDDNSY